MRHYVMCHVYFFILFFSFVFCTALYQFLHFALTHEHLLLIIIIFFEDLINQKV